MCRSQKFTIVAVAFLSWWIFLAVNVVDRETWLLENLLTFMSVGPISLAFLRGYISYLSLLLIFVYLCLHSVGAHHTYSLVPYDFWFQEYIGFSTAKALGWERNHYDRFLHFLFGLLILYPLADLLKNRLKLSNLICFTFSLMGVMAASSAYEVVEWIAAIIFSDEVGMAYLGSQGDVWDSQKDQALSIAGSSLAIILWAISARLFQFCPNTSKKFEYLKRKPH